MPPFALRSVQKTLRSSALVWNAAPYVSAACAHMVMLVSVMPIVFSVGVNRWDCVAGWAAAAPPAAPGAPAVPPVVVVLPAPVLPAVVPPAVVPTLPGAAGPTATPAAFVAPPAVAALVVPGVLAVPAEPPELFASRASGAGADEQAAVAVARTIAAIAARACRVKASSGRPKVVHSRSGMRCGA